MTETEELQTMAQHRRRIDPDLFVRIAAPAGLVVRELQFFALILSPLTPPFTTLLLGYCRSFRWLAAFLVFGLFAGLSPLWLPALPAGLSAGVSSFILAILLGMLNLAGFAIFYQKYLEDSDTLIERQLAAIIKLSRTDPLTQIANRRAFLDAFSVEMNRSQRIRWRFDNQPSQPEPQDSTAQPHGTTHGQATEQLGYLSLIMFDLDHFKSINDRYGHCIGDTVLRSTGEMLRSGGLIGDSD